MTETIKQTLRDSAVARWSALALVALSMFFAYLFMDILAPVAIMLESTHNWSPAVFGWAAGAAYMFNVLGFLIVAGIILDKIGIRKTVLIAACTMVVGAFIKFYALSDAFNNGGFGFNFFNSFLQNIPASAKLAIVGFAVFGCGVEMAGISVPKAIVKWFKGRSMALAMGLQLSLARLGIASVFFLAPMWAANGGPSKAVLIGALLLCISILTFLAYFFMDVALEKQEGEQGVERSKFKVSDIKTIFQTRAFLIIAGLCVLYYVSIFPFQKFALGMLESKSGLANAPMELNRLFMLFPIGAMLLTPLLGWFLDVRGKGATMLIYGALLMSACHLVFAIVPGAYISFPLALTAIVLLGISFSLVPASLWPSVPKLVENKVLGSAYAIIFWVQNIGLWLMPVLIGYVLKATNPGIDVTAGGVYNYSTVMYIFASFGIMALFLGFWLRAEDKRGGYGMELPNKKK